MRNRVEAYDHGNDANNKCAKQVTTSINAVDLKKTKKKAGYIKVTESTMCIYQCANSHKSTCTHV